jgi:hypothetical protein
MKQQKKVASKVNDAVATVKAELRKEKAEVRRQSMTIPH